MRLVAAAGVCVAALLVAATSTGRTRNLWLATAFRAESRPPCPTPESNPFGVQGSGIGKTLSYYMALSGETAEHMGVTPKKELPWTLGSARAVNALEAGLVTLAPHSHEAEEHAEEPAHERRERVAGATMRSDVKTAWLLDPTNYDALQVYSGVAQKSGEGERVQLQDAGRVFDLPLGEARVVQLNRYSLARFDVGSGRWPEHCVYAAQSLIAIWLSEFPQAKDEERKAAKNAALADVVKDVERLLEAGREQQASLHQMGIWDLRPSDARELFEKRARETAAFLREARRSLGQTAPVG